MTRKLKLLMGILLLLILTSACTHTDTRIDVEEAISITQTLQESILNDADTLRLSQMEYIQNDFIVYFVNCATDNITEVAEEDRIGLYQSVTDQSYGKDPGTGMIWGYQEESYMIAEGDTGATDKTAAKWVIRKDIEINPKETGFYYDFSVPSGEYVVTCGFYNPFSARPVSVMAEGMLAVHDSTILKYQLTEETFTQKVTDGELNLLVYNPTSGDEVMKDPVLSYIIIRAVPEYNEQLVTNLIETTTLSDEEMTEYTVASLEMYKAAYKKSEEVLLKEGVTTDDYRQSYLLLKEAYTNMIKKPNYTTFRPGQEWRDTKNNVIQAHGGQVQRLTVKDSTSGEMIERWWWIGEDKTKGSRGGICAYSSDDLYNWTFEGIVMRNVTSREQLEEEEYFKELYQDYTTQQLDNVYTCINDTTSIIERPKMIYNEKTGQYIIWFHADGPTATSNSNYAAASAGVAVSDSPSGPFKFVDRYRLNTCPEDQEDKYPESKGMARDMNLYVDDDGTAYIIYSSEENLTLYISKLNSTYTYLATDPKKAVYGIDYIRIFPGAQREAPAVIKKDNKYYMMTSGCTGWAPNPSKMFLSDSMLGTWVDKGDPCIQDTRKTTFDSQSTCIFLADEKTQTFIYMGDRWNSEDLANSRYVWLPVNFDEEGNASIKFTEEWTY